MYDAVVVGGGPAGLSAAQQLARACATTLVLDAGVPRNARAQHVNGYAGLDRVPLPVFRERLRDDLTRYPEVELAEAWVDRVNRQDEGGFTVWAGDRSWQARRVLLATGVVDVLPDLPDVDAYWGTSVVQCPFCHGWEARTRPAAVVIGDDVLLAEMLRFHGRWATSLVALAAPGWEPTSTAREVLGAAGVSLHEAPVVALHGHDGVLQELEFADGSTADVGTVYVHNEQRPTDLVRVLGLDLTFGAYVAVRKDYAVPDPTLPLFVTSVPGIYAAGDATSTAQAAQLAAFEGALAARRMVLDHAFTDPGR
ncbi:NAD(P)/FAD-dependent oxidoreductase [Phycicoccus sp. M110.8]|uniref:NAD(P)/FAD-dependent oxidoreductase n=1 Tax=Phycicoccus sp. M110.8 TaxID=3075433 RepID=UPI0028FD26FC|nr:NAD(P)/FAD-dependent oxidoreductase [Phycicoccus sp. M110.8]MDU0312069.1 NAD(P)/FAD-dependent oxidoreductase [Phycicoccus sp. M110.8]